MMKRFIGFVLFLGTSSFLLAQDMPPLPALPDQGNQAASSANSAPATSTLPPLPNQSAAPATAPAANTDNTGQALPPLPNQPAAPAGPASSPQTATPAASTDNSGGLPPLPNQQAAPAAGPTNSPQTTTPGAEQPQPSTAPEAQPAPKKTTKKVKPWQVSRYRPNAIFDGWVRAKGGNESSRMAWASQEVLNALLFKGYRNIPDQPEEGAYDGEGKKEWRRITFKAPKSKLMFKVYLKSAGKKILLRLRPNEPALADAYSLSQVQRIRKADLAALHLLQKKFGRRLTPGRVVVSWEPKHYQQTAGEEDE
jgi:hypothetical protein